MAFEIEQFDTAIAAEPHDIVAMRVILDVYNYDASCLEDDEFQVIISAMVDAEESGETAVKAVAAAKIMEIAYIGGWVSDLLGK